MQGFYSKQKFWFIFKKNEGEKISSLKVQGDVIYGYTANGKQEIISTFDYPITQIAVFMGVKEVEDFAQKSIGIIKQGETKTFTTPIDRIGCGFLVDVNTEATYE